MGLHPSPVATKTQSEAKRARYDVSVAAQMTEPDALKHLDRVVSGFGAAPPQPIELDDHARVAQRFLGVSDAELARRVEERRAQEVETLRPAAQKAAESVALVARLKAEYQAQHNGDNCPGFQPGRPNERDPRSCAVPCVKAYRAWRQAVEKNCGPSQALARFVKLQVPVEAKQAEALAKSAEATARAALAAAETALWTTRHTIARNEAGRERTPQSVRSVERAQAGDLEEHRVKLEAAQAAHVAAKNTREVLERQALERLAPPPAVAAPAPTTTTQKPAPKARKTA